MSILGAPSDSWTIQPEEPFEVPPAICLEDTLERISALSPCASRSHLLSAAARRPRCATATRAWLLNDVTIVGPIVYVGPARSAISDLPDSWLIPRGADYVEFERGALVSTWSGSRWFGCYLMDDFPLELLGPGDTNISVQGKTYRDEPGYRRVLDLVPPPPRVRYGHVRQMVYYEETGVNAHKADRYRTLRGRVRERSQTAAFPAGRLIYLKRGRTGDPRVLVNEDDVEELLTRLGFEVVEPASLSVDEIVQRTMDARCVVSVEGSHKSHCIYTLADAGALVVLQPPDRFALPYKDFTDALGMRCGFVVGMQADGGFRIPVNELERVLDLVL